MTVRRIDPADLERIARLYLRVFEESDAEPSQRQVDYLRSLFIDGPGEDRDECRSLVFEQDGGIRGFLGLVPMPWSWRGEEITAVMSTAYMVDPDFRSPVASIELIRALFNGPQAFTLADGANDVSKKLWQGLGGRLSRLYSLYWTKMFNGGESGGEDLVAEPATARDICDLAPAALAHYDPRPIYAERDFEWKVGQAARKRRYGEFRLVTLKRPGDQVPCGWFSYYDGAGGVGRVMQSAAPANMGDEFVRAMLRHVRSSGATGASGRIEPELIDPMSKAGCVFNRGLDGRAKHTLLHSKDEDLLNSLLRGDGFLTRLDGEGWLNFSEEL